jgi:lysophospholipid acyltransferase (LPLAT)-like uncharacterized protein
VKTTVRLKFWLLPILGHALIRLLGRTLRLQRLPGGRVEALRTAGQNVIYAFWHGRQLMLPLSYTGRGAYVMISEHRDGELIHRVLQRFGGGAVRGSSTRGATKALRQLVRLGRAGFDLAITPDGPRGPRCIAQPGIIELAKLTGLPIVPLTFAASKKKFSRAGTGLRCRCRSAAHASCGESRSGWPLRRINTSSRRSEWNCKQP